MGMRLLPKSEIDKAKAREQRMEIDEGLKIARRVDNLREVHAETEASYETFRRETVSRIHEEITTESEKLEKVRHQVKAAEERREIALKPLDEYSQRLQKDAEDLKKREEAFAAKSSKFDDDSSRLEHSRRESERASSDARYNVEVSNQKLNEALVREQRSKDVQREAESALSKAQKKADAIEQEVTHRLAIVSEREQGVTMQEKALADREAALSLSWTLLKDREAMLARTIKRTQ